MSHTSILNEVPIRDINALRSAVQELAQTGKRISIEENTRPRMWDKPQEVMCDYVVKIPEARFDVGLKKNNDGSYAPFTDPYGGTVHKVLGAEGGQNCIGLLVQGYVKHAAINTAAQQGMIVESCTVDAKGTVQLVLAR